MDPNNPNSPIQASEFLDVYMRARMVGGRDVTPDQVFQVMKYLKAAGQSLDIGALLTTFIAMPDIRGSTFGNQLNMMIRGLTGGATQAALQAAARAGLGTITERTASGPHGFQVVDEVMLRENPFAWFARHIMGPQGVLRRAGLDPNTASMAQITTALRPIFSNQSAMNIATMIVGQWREWQGQVQNSLRLSLTPGAREDTASGSLWHGLLSARSALIGALGAIAKNFELILLPAANSVAGALRKVAEWTDPRTGSRWLSMGLLAAGGVGGFMLLRRLMGATGPLGRILLGTGLGFAVGGSFVEAMLGGLMMRNIGSSLAGGAAGGAAAAAGATLGRRLLRGLWAVMRRIPGFLLFGAVVSGIAAIADNWDAVKVRVLAVWEELRKAAPTWLGGEGQGWAQVSAGLQGWIQGNIRPNLDAFGGWMSNRQQAIEDSFRSTALGRWFIEHGWLPNQEQLARRRGAPGAPSSWADSFMHRFEESGSSWGLGGRSDRTGVPPGTVTVTTGAINVTVNVASSNADPSTIGNAAGNAVRGRLRELFADDPAPGN